MKYFILFFKASIGFISSCLSRPTTWEVDVRNRLNHKQSPPPPPLQALLLTFFFKVAFTWNLEEEEKCVWICFGYACGVSFAPVPPVKGSRLRPCVRPHAAAMKMGVQTAPGEDWPPSQLGSVLSRITCKYYRKKPYLNTTTKLKHVCTLLLMAHQERPPRMGCCVYKWVMNIGHHRGKLCTNVKGNVPLRM